MPNLTVRDATQDDVDSIVALLPQLASFDVPEHRNPRHLWEGDAELLMRWANGDAAQSFVQVAELGGELAGATIVTLRKELLSGEPSAHLEVIVVASEARGSGVGKQLLEAAETKAHQHGARSMSLHVFARNVGARGFYEHAGFDGELMRYYKPLDLS